MAPSGPETVLVVDDDERVLTRCADLLHAAGMEVRVAGSVAAVERAVADTRLDVVVASMQLRDLTAGDLLRIVRARDTDLPVVFVAGWPDFDDSPARSLRSTVLAAARGRRQRRRAFTP